MMQSILSRCAAVFCAAVVLGACTATPDLSGWSTSSADLAGAVSSENSAVLKRLDVNIAEMEAGKKEGWTDAVEDTKKWRGWRKSFKQGSDEINAGMTAMTLYAEAISKLAAKGETGAEAAGKIVKSLGDIGNLIGVAFPAAPAVTKIITEIAAIWTKVQAQDALAKGMSDTDPKIGELANLITAAVNSQKGIVDQIRRKEAQLARAAAGPERMKWFDKNKGYAANEAVFKDANDAKTPEAKRNAATVLAAANTYLIEVLAPRFRAREKRVLEIKQWRKARRQALDAIAAAVPDWRTAHQEATTVLVNCGGFRSLKFECGNYTAANLKLAAQRIKDVVAATAPEPEPAQ